MNRNVLRLSGPVGLCLGDVAGASAAGLAAADVLADLTDALGASAVFTTDARAAAIRLVPANQWPEERWEIDVDRQQVVIRGGQPLGLVYALYAFAERFLGVDPLHFFTDRRPTPRDGIDIPLGLVARSTPAVFRYRGWFINDEDLLSEWRDGGGTRHIDYPFYAQVTHPDIIDRVAEALLRLGGNLIIPASFLDVTNEPEAELVRRCVRRGLFVSQHHVEPMGVSHFGYENYWRSRGVAEPTFRYVDEPDRLRETWRAFAQRWHELAGDRVVWQLGLRGRGDRPIWVDDDAITRETGGAIISRAIAEQWAIACDVDPRPNPPGTTTLFMEGSDLMAEGSLTFPEGVAVIFCDAGNTQRMQRDFHEAAREARYRYGAYYHLAFWGRGPHLCQGVPPDRLAEELSAVIDKGDTHYAILNVANVREFAYALRPAMSLLARGTAERDARLPAEVHGLYDAFYDALARSPSGEVVQDGNLQVLTRYAQFGDAAFDGALRRVGFELANAEVIARDLDAAAAGIDEVVAAVDASPAVAAMPEADRRFVVVNLRTQAAMLGALYHAAAAAVRRDTGWQERAASHIDAMLAARAAAADGPKWHHWYRGDRKANWLAIRDNLRRKDA